MQKLLILLLIPCCLRGQQLADSTVGKIDKIFSQFTSSTPGCAVAVMQDGQVVLQKGYGMANLEYDAPIKPATTFHIASESKQFVAFCILLLEKEGKLSINDDIRKHLDFVPDFGHTITIRQLINHTSGLRDQWQLLANAGWQLDDVITRDHVIKLVSKQKTLNFPPGSEFMYCNTGYTLLAEIVQKISGQSLREFAKKSIFEPLGMNSTHFHDNYQEIVPQRAYSYAPRPFGGYEHAVLSYSIVGATSLHTSVLDELKWLHNFEQSIEAHAGVTEKMLLPGELNDGRKLNYAFGVVLDKFKGWDLIGHGGADAGFRSFACRIPEKKLSIAVFSNLASANPASLARQIAGVLIPEEKPLPKREGYTNIADSNFLKRLQGNYYSERGELGSFIWKNGKLYQGTSASTARNEVNLANTGNNRFASVGDGPTLIIDDQNLRSDSVMELRVEQRYNTSHFKRQPKIIPPVSAEFAGRYYSEETEGFYTVIEKDGELTLDHRKFNTVPLKLIAPDQFNTPHWWMSHIRFIRNKRGKILGFEVNSGRVMGLRYNRIE